MPRAVLKRARDGVLYCRPYLGTDRVTGRPMRPYRSFPGMSEAEAQEAADAWLASLAAPAAAGTDGRLAPMLERFVTDPARGYSGATRATYLSCIRCYVAPTIGDVPYASLEPYEVRAAYRILRTDRRGRPAISPATLRKVHALLCAAYRAWSDELGRDPMLSVERPACPPAEPFALDEWDQERLSLALLEAMSSDARDRASVIRRTTAFAAYLALMQGLRCGEALAVRRRDVREGPRDIAVRGTVVERPRLARQPYPKRGSAGNVSMAPELEREIARHEAWQDGWMDAPGPSTPLVTYRADGALARPSDVSRRFRALADRLGLPRECTFHTLRHTHATWLLMHGWDMRTIQERLRHRDVATTLRLYATVMPGRDRAAAEAFASGLAAGEG